MTANEEKNEEYLNTQENIHTDGNAAGNIAPSVVPADKSTEIISEQIRKKLEIGNVQFDEERLTRRANGFYNRIVKRIIDFVLALVIILLLSPVYLLISIAIVIDSGFPVFYRPYRGGYKGKNFRTCKFRTMVKNADKIGGGTTALNDSRITRVGKFLRKTKLDEIANAFCCLIGTMSFIGPRPELTRYTDTYNDLEKHILDVRPGITDYSSIELISLDEVVGEKNADEIYEKYVYKTKNALRLKYVNNISFATDVKLFFATIGKVIGKAFRVIFKRKKKDKKQG